MKIRLKNAVLVALACFFILGMADTISAQCDRASAMKVKQLLSSMANASEKGDALYYSWIDDWHGMTLPQKEQMTTFAANSDACLTGKARSIYIHFRGELVAEASPTWGIKVLK